MGIEVYCAPSSGFDMPNRDAIFVVLAEFAEAFGLEKSRIAPTASLYDLGVDSLQLIELTFRFEEAFKIQVPVEAFNEKTTVADAMAIIEGLIEAQVRAPSMD